MVRSLKGKHPLYFEAILQMREADEEAVYFAKEEIMRAHVPVVKIKKAVNGLDFYLADNNFAKALGKKLQEKFGGKVNFTASLFGQKDGKEIYRVTVLFRQAHFKKGEIVKYHGEEYLVIYLGKEILLQNKNTGEKVHLKYKEMKKIKKI